MHRYLETCRNIHLPCAHSIDSAEARDISWYLECTHFHNLGVPQNLVKGRNWNMVRISQNWVMLDHFEISLDVGKAYILTSRVASPPSPKALDLRKQLAGCLSHVIVDSDAISRASRSTKRIGCCDVSDTRLPRLRCPSRNKYRSRKPFPGEHNLPLYPTFFESKLFLIQKLSRAPYHY